MKSYICGIIGSALIIAMIAILMPDNLNREVKFMSALALICVIVSPISGVAKSIKSSIENGFVFNPPKYDSPAIPGELYDALARQSEKEINDCLRSKICERFSLSEEEVTVVSYIKFNNDRPTLEKVCIVLKGRGMFTDPHEVILFAEKLADAPCEVVNG